MNLTQRSIVRLLIFAWLLFSLSVFAPNLIPDNIEALARLGFQGSAQAQLYVTTVKEAFQFLFLFIPRLLFLVALFFTLRSQRITPYKLSGENLLTFQLVLFVLLLIGSVLGYPPLVLSVALLFCWNLAALAPSDTLRIFYMGLIVIGGMALGFGRSLLFLCTLAFFFNLTDLKKSSALKMAIIFLVVISAITFSKFDSRDTTVLLNLVQRFGVVNQMGAWLHSDLLILHSGKPMTLDALQQFPLVRRYYESVDEVFLFEQLTGNTGGLAVGPELRAASFWKTQFATFADISCFYLLLFVFSRLVIKFIPVASFSTLVMFPLLTQLDSLYIVSLYVQMVAFHAGIIAIFITKKGLKR